MVDTNEQAARVSGAIRDELVRLGRVDEHGVPLRDGTFAGVGDVVQGRRVAWDLAGYEGNRRGPINREHYRVTAVRDDGALEVTVVAARRRLPPPTPSEPPADEPRAEGSGWCCPRSTSPADLTLAYAVTVHAAEGATVETAHPVSPRAPTSTPSTSSSPAAATPTPPTSPPLPAPTTPPTATTSTRCTATPARSSPRSSTPATRSTTPTAPPPPPSRTPPTWARVGATAGERFADAAHDAATERTARWLDALVTEDVLDPHDRARIAAEDGNAALTRVLRQAEIAGHDPADVLRGAVDGRPFDGAHYVSAVVTGRIRNEHTFEPTGATWTDWLPRDIEPDARRHLEVTRRCRRRPHPRTRRPSRRRAARVGPRHPRAAVPDNDTARTDWITRAGAIAAHRELGGHTNTPDPATLAG